MSYNKSGKKLTEKVAVTWKDKIVQIGGGNPVVVQSMTNTDTSEVIKTAVQIKELSDESK